jgi:hypothetical protein
MAVNFALDLQDAQAERMAARGLSSLFSVSCCNEKKPRLADQAKPDPKRPTPKR